MLSYEEARSYYGPDANPRWVRCHAELGHRPSELTYISWLRGRQFEFMKVSNIRLKTWRDAVEHYGVALQVRFDTWLAQRSEPAVGERHSRGCACTCGA